MGGEGAEKEEAKRLDCQERRGKGTGHRGRRHHKRRNRGQKEVQSDRHGGWRRNNFKQVSPPVNDEEKWAR